METRVRTKELPKRSTISTPPPVMSNPSTTTKGKDLTVSNLTETWSRDGPLCHQIFQQN